MAEFNPIKDDNLIALTRLFFEKMAGESDNKLVFCMSIEKAILNQFEGREDDLKELFFIEEYTTTKLELSLAMCERVSYRYKQAPFTKTFTMGAKTRHFKTVIKEMQVAVSRMIDIMISCIIEENIKLPQDIMLQGIEAQSFPKL